MEAVRVGIWAKRADGWGKVGDLRSWTELELEPRFNRPGPWSLTVPFDTQSAKITRQRLLTFDFHDTRMTGVVEALLPHSDENGNPRLTVAGVDALALLSDALCWPDPAAALGSQAVTHYQATGAAETVLRGVIEANFVTRRGEDVTLPASAGRGTTITLNERFSNLLEVVQKGADVGGLGVRMGLVDTTSATRAEMTVEFWAPADKSQRVRLSHTLGNLRSWHAEQNAPTGTRAIVAGGGKGTSRVFRQVVDADAETSWNRKREVFVDARDTSTTTLLDQRGQEALAEAAAQTAFELETADAEGVRYGRHYGLGDKVTVELLTGLTVVEPLGAVRARMATEGGLTLQMIPGNPDAPPKFAVGAIMRALRRRLNVLEREET